MDAIPFRRCTMHRIPRFTRIAGVVAGLMMAAAGPVAPVEAATSSDLAYADGQTYVMDTPHAMPASNPGLEKVPPIWVMVFGPNAIPPGYAPQCDPCDHPNNPNLPGGGDFHDHLLPGAPGEGVHGTAGDYMAPWLITIVVFNPRFTGGNASFAPIKSDTQLAAVEAESAAALRSGGVPELLPINSGAANPFELPTGTVLICPIVRAG
jgi:hypothetical protein